MEAPLAASPQPTARQPQAKELPTVKPLRARGPPTVKPLKARELPTVMPALQIVSCHRATGLPGVEQPGVSALPPRGKPRARGLPAALVARVPSEAARGDTTDPALAPPAAEAPPAWDLGVAEAPVAVAVVAAGEDKRKIREGASFELLAGVFSALGF